MNPSDPSSRPPAGPTGLGASNPGLQHLRRLARRRSARLESGAYVVDGPVLVAEALEAGVAVQAVYAETDGLGSDAVAAARRAGVPVREVQPGVLAKVLDVVNPQPVAAVATARASDLGAVLAGAAAAGRPVLVLVGLQDPGNAGTLVRVAEGAGCAGVVLTEHSVDAHNPKTVRAAAGALFRVPLVERVTAADVLAASTAAGLASWATVGRGGVPLDEAPLAGAVALLVGSEAHGLPDDVVAACDGTVTVPMEGRVESLNAGVAGALVAFEAARQRRSGPGPGTGSGPGVAVGHNVSSGRAPDGPAPDQEQGQPMPRSTT